MVRSTGGPVQAARPPTSATDLTLRGLWQLVGVYVWVVLLFKRRVPARRYD